MLSWMLRRIAYRVAYRLVVKPAAAFLIAILATGTMSTGSPLQYIKPIAKQIQSWSQ